MPIRALIVDDREPDRKSLVDILTTIGCLVEPVATLEEAKTKIIRELFHIVTIDIQLSELASNRDGTTLEKWLSDPVWDSYVSRFVVSSTSVVSELIRSVSAVNTIRIKDPQYNTGVLANNTWYFSKPPKLDEDALLQKVQAAVKDRNFQLMIGGSDQIEIIAARIQSEIKRRIDGERENGASAYAWFQALSSDEQLHRLKQEIEDLLRQIFPGAVSVELTAVGQGLSGSSVIQATPISEDVQQYPVLIKLGYWQQIATEMDRYQRFVRGHIKQRPALQASGRTVLLSAIIYDWLDEVVSFGRYYTDPNNTDESIVALVEDLFTQVCHKWYSETSAKLIEYHKDYPSYLRCTAKAVSESLPYLKVFAISQQQQLQFPELDHALPNPAYVLEAQEMGRSTLAKNSRWGITHGDFNENNVLIRTQFLSGTGTLCMTQPWIIDFYRTQKHDVLRDFAQLEATVKFNLLPADVSLTDCYTLEKLLVQQQFFSEADQLLPSTLSMVPRGLERTLKVVAAIRRSAYSIIFRHPGTAQATSFDSYLAALFYCSINLVRYVQKSAQQSEGLTIDRARYALLASAIIAERLRMVAR